MNIKNNGFFTKATLARLSPKAASKVALLLLSFIVSGCTTYSKDFKCRDARGVGCTMMREIDNQIESGKIEEAYMDKKSRSKCSGKNGKCKSGVLLISAPVNRASLHEEPLGDNGSNSSDIEDGSLYF
jgi:hypothetical protein